MKIIVHQEGQASVLLLCGQFDFDCHRQFRRAIADQLTHQDGPLTLDLTEVESLSAAAIGMILIAHTDCHRRGRQLILRYPQGFVARLLKTADLERFCHILWKEEHAPALTFNASDVSPHHLHEDLRV